MAPRCRSTVRASAATRRPAGPVAVGTAITYSADAPGSIRIRWQRCVGDCLDDRNWLDIPGATSSSYTTPPIAPADAGVAYRARVTGACAFDQTSPADPT